MPTIQELVQLVAEGDEEAQEQLVQLIGQKDQNEAQLKLELKLKTDKDTRSRYPRALRSWERGRLSLSGAASEDEIMSLLESEENSLAELGVPIDSPVDVPAPTISPAEPEDDPAKSLAGAGGSNGPGGAPRDYVYEIVELMHKGTTLHDQAEWQKKLVALNKSGQKDKIAEITRLLEARPIVPSGI